jgi:hypothetical protein
MRLDPENGRDPTQPQGYSRIRLTAEVGSALGSERGRSGQGRDGGVSSLGLLEEPESSALPALVRSEHLPADTARAELATGERAAELRNTGSTAAEQRGDVGEGDVLARGVLDRSQSVSDTEVGGTSS